MIKQIGNYQLAELLGQGGAGVVYRSTHPILNQPVAVKLMLPTLSADPEARQRFIREAQVAASLAHPNIINIYEVGTDQGTPFIVTEYLPTSLAKRLRNGPLSVEEALRIALPLAEALEYTHRQQIVHRDLKPSNVLLRADGSPVLADFGLARLPGGSVITATNDIFGTVAYMAPEQIRGETLDPRTDLYAFGVMFYEIVSGRLPFDGDPATIITGHLNQIPPPLTDLAPQVPPALSHLISQLLAKNPNDRPASARVLAEQFQQLLGGGGQTISLRPQAPAARAFDWRIVGLLGVGILLVSLFFSWIGFEPRRFATPTATISVSLPTNSIRQIPTKRPEDAPTAPPAIPTTIPTPAPTLAVTWDQTIPTIIAGNQLNSDIQQIASPPFPNPQPAGPGPFSVSGVHMVKLRGDTNAMYVFGEVRNDSDLPQPDVRVKLELHNPNGQIVDVAESSIDRDFLNPGEIAPFSVIFNNNAMPTISTIGVAVQASNSAFMLEYSRRRLQISNVQIIESDTSGIKVIGQITSNEVKPVQFVQIYLVMYDGQGRVVAIATTFATGQGELLQPEQSLSWSINPIIIGRRPVSFRLYAEASPP